MSPPRIAIADYFADLPDPRVDRTKKHLPGDLLVIAVCAVIAGADSFEEIETFGKAKHAWLKRFLALPNGIPSHDTFNRGFAALDRKAFAACFARWMAGLVETVGLRPIAIDGKAVRSALRDTFSGCLHLVSAWAVEHHRILGQEAVADGAHETAALPELLRVLDLKGALVTIDAAGCPGAIARQLRVKQGHSRRAVKGNPPALADAVQAVFDRACEADFAGVRYDTAARVEDGHGRHEERYVTVIYDPEGCRGRALGQGHSWQPSSSHRMGTVSPRKGQKRRVSRDSVRQLDIFKYQNSKEVTFWDCSDLSQSMMLR